MKQLPSSVRVGVRLTRTHGRRTHVRCGSDATRSPVRVKKRAMKLLPRVKTSLDAPLRDRALARDYLVQFEVPENPQGEKPNATSLETEQAKTAAAHP
jgi:hypothetical protein